MILTFADLIKKHAGDDTSFRKWKVVRHRDNRDIAPDLLSLYYFDRPALDMYQSGQGSDVFGDCDGIFSCIGLPGGKALFYGAYRVDGPAQRARRPSVVIPESLRLLENPDSPTGERGYFYDLKPDFRFSELETRVVIDWGKGALAWHQWSLDKEIVELRPAGQLEPCASYSDIDITLAKLDHLMRHPDANPSWVHRLSAVGGIYLVTNQENGRSYVGQAGGERGFWGRWQQYAACATGNVAVDAAFARGELRRDNTSMSILEIVPRDMQSKGRLDQLESRWKRRLGTRFVEVGYNQN